MMETQTAHPPPTRYKTVRRANPPIQGTNAASGTAPQQQGTPANDALSRSRSRYRRRPTIETGVIPVPSIPSAQVPHLPKEILRDQPSSAAPKLRLDTAQDDQTAKSPTSPMVGKSRPPTSPIVAKARPPTSPIVGKSRPQTSAAQTPASAIGGGFQNERKINVQVGKETLTVSVPIDTEASTLAAAVSKLVPEKTIYGASILLESFKGLGLERPVRKYERIRDIMNGWEDDTRNTLILISSLSGGEGLNAADAPVEPPAEASTWINYMVKPGKWSKRWITMRDGAILMAKKDTAKKDKDFQHICHLSDFDIYDPTPTTASNVLKCPKRHCFAIKSQQKASLFQNTSDWVHYFSTNDRNIYTTWQNLLRSWRAYYLVQVKGCGQAPKQEKKIPSDDEERPARKIEDTSSHRSRTASRPPTGDASGSPGRKKFTPLISEEELAKPPPPIDTSFQRTKSLKGTGKYGSFTTATPTVPPLPDGEVFAPTGLLGRTYTQKVKDMQDAEKEQRLNNFPFFNATPANGTSGKCHKRASSVESALNVEPRNSDPLKPSHPLNRKPKPLLDFSDTETSQPPLPKGRYRARTLVNNSSAPPSGGLISAATGPATYDAPPLPNSALWNKPRSRPPTRDKGDSALRFGEQGSPFTGAGLLAHSHDGAGAVSTGHGVHRKGADGTLLDMRNKSIFAQGSLLAKVERERGCDGPIIDRCPESSDSG